MTKNVVIIGTQWGDEGKGKIVDWLAAQSSGVVRFQGGHNAGHTLVINGVKIALHIIPSGIMNKKVKCYIGNGVVLSLPDFIIEINKLEALKVEVKNRLRVSDACPLILPYHTKIDSCREKALGVLKIGTTGKGIGPAYEDKVARRAIRLGDLNDEKIFKNKLENNLQFYNYILKNYFKTDKLDFQKIFDTTLTAYHEIKDMVSDISRELNVVIKEGANLLFEGAQGSLLDVDHGTYPFVTSSNCVAGNASVGSGVGPNHLNYILGVTKAYSTRVGSGPFPSEVDTNFGVGSHLSKNGLEFGTTTGRSRRCGWLDIPLLKRSIQINGINGISLTKLDVLDGIDSLKICTAYKCNGKYLDLFPNNLKEIINCQPIYEELKGWSESIFGCKSLDKLPIQARKYIDRIEKLIDIPVEIISTGPDREQTIFLNHPFDNKNHGKV